MKTITYILQNKSNELFSVSPSTSVFEALQLMMDKNISALLVMEGNELKGIFTERDYARKIVLQGRSSKTTLISEVMTSELITIAAAEPIENCMELMTRNHIRHLPVVENGSVSGMISIGDVVKSLIELQKTTIQQLESYISN
ncbi:MAG: hypothetical protein K0S09_2201 [Sphingobacteriaceae bacterium]|jgi:signal-transduction protein with cAMP-binding, CBS, and nucleotidyltransferase domain|nr:hypothetical protein [Sphingobacteriaceae bacterium]